MKAHVDDDQGSRSRAVEDATVNGNALLLAPAAVREIDVDPETSLEDVWLPPSRCGRPYRSALLLVRLRGELVGTAAVRVDPEGRIPHGRIAEALLSRFEGVPLMPRAFDEDANLDAEPERSKPSISVVVPTCSNPAALEPCLRSVLACD
jgi:hypothetical protein